MNDTKKDKDRKSSPIASLISLFLLSIFLIVAYLLFKELLTEYIARSDHGFAHLSMGELGTLGDFVGGILNPSFAILTIILLIYTNLQQHKVIRMQREELEATNATLIDQKEIAEKQLKAIRSEAHFNHILNVFRTVQPQLDIFYNKAFKISYISPEKGPTELEYEKIGSAFSSESYRKEILECMSISPLSILKEVYLSEDFSNYRAEGQVLLISAIELSKLLGENAILFHYLRAAESHAKFQRGLALCILETVELIKKKDPKLFIDTERTMTYGDLTKLFDEKFLNDMNSRLNLSNSFIDFSMEWRSKSKDVWEGIIS